MSAGNPSGPVVVAGGPATDTDGEPDDAAEAVAWDLAHLVANGVAVAVVCDPEGSLADALATVGVATESCDPPAGGSTPAPGVVALYPADESDPATVAADLGATLVSLAADDGPGGGCVPGAPTDTPDPAPTRHVVADAGLKNPVLAVLGGATADGGHVEVAP